MSAKQSAAATNGGAKKGGALSVLGRVLKMLFSFYPVLLPITLVAVVVNAIIQAMPNVFMERVLTIVGSVWQTGDWAGASHGIILNAATLASLYVLATCCSTFWTQSMAIITQGSLKKFRCKMFDHMQSLPIRYFDTHQHGDVMSYYTNDIDAMRMMISQSLPQLLFTSLMLIMLMGIMLFYSIPMALVVVGGVLIMVSCTKFLGTRSAKNFVRQQKAIAGLEGHVEEAMGGQRVIKVFCHEDEAQADFERINDELEAAARSANTYANTLMPILMNLGNLLYVIVALAGGVFLALGIPNLSLSGLPLTIAVAVPFLNMTKQFTAQIGQVSNQINAVVMGMAGAKRIFELLDEEPEHDEGYVTLVNARRDDATGKLVECSERTGTWAWKHPHSTGEVEYVPLEGDVVMEHVDFGYTPDHEVLHDVSVYAKPGQKVAFVGATGAGKTTLINLLMRFYEIDGGRITLDGVDTRAMDRGELRRNFGMVLQDAWLFDGTIADNIAYGCPGATREQIIEAARMAHVDFFVRTMPQGYDTHVANDAENISQGQRQLLTIARVILCDPKILILDEATSSVDTRTEQAIVHAMETLMQGRTSFVIAHRLSTIVDADLILVMQAGAIIEQGTHQELLEAGGSYAELYRSQFM